MEKLIDENTRAVFCESIGNPDGNVADIEGLARVAHKHGVPLIVDNTVATPILLRPIEYGADVVVHAMTKFMGGHGTTLGGMIVDSGKFPWLEYADRYYMLTRPEIAYHGVVYTDHYGAAAFVARCRTVCQRNTGSTLSPFNSFLLLQGVETLALRMERHVENARKVAEFLRDHKQVEWVNYAGFPDNPRYAIAQKYLGANRSSLLTFGVKGGLAAGTKCFNAFRLFKRMVNMGDAKSLTCHPASTTHRQLTPEEQRRVGVTPEMIRLSVGIEHIDDILDDLSQALEKSTDRGLETMETIIKGRPVMRLFLDRGKSLTGWTEEGFVPVAETTKGLIRQAIVSRLRSLTTCRTERSRIPSRNFVASSAPPQTACRFTFGFTLFRMSHAGNA